MIVAVVAGQPRRHLVERQLGEDRDAVEGLLTMHGHVVAEASNGSRGKASSTHLVSCRQTMSGCRSLSQATALSTRCLMELTFQVAIRMPKIPGRDSERMAAVHARRAAMLDSDQVD